MGIETASPPRRSRTHGWMLACGLLVAFWGCEQPTGSSGPTFVDEDAEDVGTTDVGGQTDATSKTDDAHKNDTTPDVDSALEVDTAVEEDTAVEVDTAADADGAVEPDAPDGKEADGGAADSDSSGPDAADGDGGLASDADTSDADSNIAETTDAASTDAGANDVDAVGPDSASTDATVLTDTASTSDAADAADTQDVPSATDATADIGSDAGVASSTDATADTSSDAGADAAATDAAGPDAGDDVADAFASDVADASLLDDTAAGSDADAAQDSAAATDAASGGDADAVALPDCVSAADCKADACRAWSCTKGVCVAGKSLVCDDGNSCTSNGCDVSLGCVFAPIDGSCSDGSVCTSGDVCSGGKCGGTVEISCDDALSCTKDFCSPTDGCMHAFGDGACEDGDLCTEGDTCSDQVCVAGGKANCDDLNPCTADSCDSKVGCGHEITAGASCLDLGVCLADGSCCNTQCDGVACGGDDGCGSTCGCAEDSVCTEGKCVVPVEVCGGSITASGCCDGDSLRYCSGSKLHTVSCDGGCGWSAAAGYYDCGFSGGEPSGTLPLACPALCTAGASTCTGTDSATFCDGSYNPISYACPGCKDSPAGALCPGWATLQPYAVSLSYQYREPALDFTDWGQLQLAPMAGMWALVVREIGGVPVVLDAAKLDEAGQVTVQVPNDPTATDQIAFAAADYTENGGHIRYAVALPGLDAGAHDVSDVAAGTASIWSWSLPGDLWAQGTTWEIGPDQHSGPAHLFHWTRAVFEAGTAAYGKDGLPLVVWSAPDTTWSCGACFWTAVPTTLGGVPMASSIWMPWDANESYWSSAVMAHEAGHWWMESFGLSPNEGGTHYLASQTFPGQAWSEGFATWLSSAARQHPRYFDKQGYVFFWIDLAAKLYISGSPIAPATVQEGVLQKMDENLVASMLWGLTVLEPAAAVLGSPALAGFWTALSSQRMTIAPFARGYTMHTWEVTETGEFLNVVDTGVSVPMVADFFDALRCVGGLSAQVINAVTGTYPYNANNPLCGTGGKP